MQAPDTFPPQQTTLAGSAPPNSLLIVGASARGAAWSAIHAGFTPFALDCFADCDLVDRAWAQRITEYPSEILRASRQLPAMPWMYTGGLENYPAVVDALSQDRPLLGNVGNVLRQVRDPEIVSTAWEKMNVRAPAVSLQPPENGERQWLAKRRNSAAGLGVHWFHPNARPTPDVYYQRFVRGTPWSSLYVANGAEAVLLGSSRQCIGDVGLENAEFLYCGSIAIHRSPVRREWLEQLGSGLASRFSLRGLFGVDWIYHRGNAWPVDVNPRYTASCELWERACEWPLMAWHSHACREGTLPQPPRPSGKIPLHGKGILYARQSTVITDRFAALTTQLNCEQPWPQVADLPAAGQHIEVRHPVVTLFATGATAAEVQFNINRLAVRIRRELAC